MRKWRKSDFSKSGQTTTNKGIGFAFCIFLHDFSSSSTLEVKLKSIVACAYANSAYLSYETLYDGKFVGWPLECNSHGDHLMDGNHERTFQIEIFIQEVIMNLSS